MLDFFAKLFDTAGFLPRKSSGEGWSTELIWLHATSDLFIWLAYISIPLTLLYFTRRRDLPFPRLFILFAVFILSCGTTHLLDAIGFEYPIYRFAGLMKFVTAVVSWANVYTGNPPYVAERSPASPVVPSSAASTPVPAATAVVPLGSETSGQTFVQPDASVHATGFPAVSSRM